MSRIIKVSDEVYDALQTLKDYPSTSFSDIIKGVLELQFPGDFFGDTDAIDRQLIREELGMENRAPGELRQIVKARKMRKKVNNDNTDIY